MENLSHLIELRLFKVLQFKFQLVIILGAPLTKKAWFILGDTIIMENLDEGITKRKQLLKSLSF